MGDTSLKLKLPRLFDLFVNKESTVEEMATLGWEVGGRGGSGDVVCWHGRRKVWRGALSHNIVLQVTVHDYSVRGAYHFITTSGTIVDRNLVDDVWHLKDFLVCVATPS